MPIKASYCNAFYDACKDDLFCGYGNFFECARIDPNVNSSAQNTTNNREKQLQEEADMRKSLQEAARSRNEDTGGTKVTVPGTIGTEESSACVFGLAALALLS
jgi:hypothetical protein